jgi:hypothetical protein
MKWLLVQLSGNCCANLGVSTSAIENTEATQAVDVNVSILIGKQG